MVLFCTFYFVIYIAILYVDNSAVIIVIPHYIGEGTKPLEN